MLQYKRKTQYAFVRFQQHPRLIWLLDSQRIKTVTSALIALVLLTSVCWVSSAVASQHKRLPSSAVKSSDDCCDNSPIDLYNDQPVARRRKDHGVVIVASTTTTRLQHLPRRLPQHPLSLLKHGTTRLVKSLVALEDGFEDTVLKAFRFMTHPVVLLDIAVILVGHAITSGWLSLPSSMFWILGYPRRWLRMAGSARRWTRLVSFVFKGRGKSHTKAVTQVLRALKNPFKSAVKLVRALWENRSRYSLLSDYAWYVTTTNGESEGSALHGRDAVTHPSS